MIYTLSNEKLSISFSTKGGELMSVQNSDGIEYIWQRDKKFWSGGAYNLFPIVGRLEEGKYIYDEKEYYMNIHGFIRNSELEISEKTANSITFNLLPTEETLKQYPFDFSFSIKYVLSDNKVSVSFIVENNDSKDMPFSCGAHPGFFVPIGNSKDEAFDDYYLEFEEKCSPSQLLLSPRFFMSGEKKSFALVDEKIIPLYHDLFKNDAIILENMDKTISIKSKSSKYSVSVTYPDFKYLGLWHMYNPEESEVPPYVCIEPWASLPSFDGKVDNLLNKKDFCILKPNEQKTYMYEISFK